MLVQVIQTPQHNGLPLSLAFLNMYNYNVSYTNKEALKAFGAMNYLYADGVALQLIRYILKLPTFPRVSGTDLIPQLFKQYIPFNSKVFLLGGPPSICSKVKTHFSRDFPRVKLVGMHHGFFTNLENSQIIETINASGAELLLIGMGTPAQEIWLQNNLHQLNVRVAICVGGLFQYWERSLVRAPLFVRMLGLEWFCILLQQPCRWRNYSIGTWRFFSRIATAVLNSSK